MRAERLITEHQGERRRRRSATPEGHRRSCASSARRHRTRHRRAGRSPTRTRQLAYVEVLTALVDQKTFPKFIEPAWSTAARAWSPASPGRCRAATTIRRPCCSTLLAHRRRRQAGGARRHHRARRRASRCANCCTAAYKQEANEKAALFRILGELADEQSIAGADQPPRGQGPGRARCTSSTSCRASPTGGLSGAADSSSRTPTS